MQKEWDEDPKRWHWKWEVLEYCDEAQLNEREKFWMNEVKSWAPDGFNLAKQDFTTKRKARPKEKHVGYHKTTKY